MKINVKFDQRVVIHSTTMKWVDSPMPGVARRPRDRVGGEIAGATTIVRYAPGSKFSPVFTHGPAHPNKQLDLFVFDNDNTVSNPSYRIKSKHYA